LSLAKIRTLDELAAMRPAWLAQGKKVVWTNGCFDILHAGHARSLAGAKALGDILIVGINSDESVHALKGPGRPIMNESDRAELLAALAPRRVELPPLRHRDGDVPLLAETLWKTLLEGSPSGPAPLPADFLPRYQGYLWPGNVRELWDALQARFYLGEVGARHRERDAWDEPLDSLVSRELPLAKARELAVRSFERRYVEHMLERYGSTREAAKASEVAQRYFRLLVARVGARAGLGAAGAVSPAGSSEAASAEDSPPSGKGPDPA